MQHKGWWTDGHNPLKYVHSVSLAWKMYTNCSNAILGNFTIMNAQKIYPVNTTEIFTCLCAGKQSCLWHLLLMLHTSHVFYIFRIRPAYTPLKVLYILFLEFKTLYGICNMRHSKVTLWDKTSASLWVQHQ